MARGMVVDQNGETTFWGISQTTMGDDDSKGGSLLDKLMPKENKEKTAGEARRARDKELAEKKAEEKRAEERREMEELLSLKTAFSMGTSMDDVASKLTVEAAEGGRLDVRG